MGRDVGLASSSRRGTRFFFSFGDGAPNFLIGGSLLLTSGDRSVGLGVLDGLLGVYDVFVGDCDVRVGVLGVGGRVTELVEGAGELISIELIVAKLLLVIPVCERLKLTVLSPERYVSMSIDVSGSTIFGFFFGAPNADGAGDMASNPPLLLIRWCWWLTGAMDVVARSSGIGNSLTGSVR